MTWPTRYKILVLTWISAVLFSVMPLSAASLRDILSMPTRPPINLAADLPDSELSQEAARKGYRARGINTNVIRVFDQIVQAVVKRIPECNVYLLARDMEDVYDSIDAAMQAFEPQERDAIFSRIHMLHISRKIATESTQLQMRRWLKANGIDVVKAARGEAKYLFVDTGYGSSVYIAIFQAAFGELKAQFPNATPGEVKTLSSGLLKSLDARLLATWEAPNFDSLVGEVESGKLNTFDSISSRFIKHALIFNNLLVGAELESAGLPQNYNSRGKWIIENWERLRRNWRSRAVALNDEGTEVASYEDESEKDARVDRLGLLQYQKALLQYFSEGIVRNKLLPLIQGALNRIGLATPAIRPLPETTKPAQKLEVDELDYSQVRVGETHVFPPQVPGVAPWQFTVKELVHSSSTSKVFRVANKDGDMYTLKTVANPSCEECVESLNRAADRYETLKLHNVPHTRVFVRNRNFIFRAWIEGVNALEWLQKRSAMGLDGDRGWDALQEFIGELEAKGIYIQNLGPKNLVWDGTKWWVIDMGDISISEDKAHTKSRWKDGLTRRWVPKLSPTCAQAFERFIQ